MTTLLDHARHVWEAHAYLGAAIASDGCGNITAAVTGVPTAAVPFNLAPEGWASVWPDSRSDGTFYDEILSPAHAENKGYLDAPDDVDLGYIVVNPGLYAPVPVTGPSQDGGTRVIGWMLITAPHPAGSLPTVSVQLPGAVVDRVNDAAGDDPAGRVLAGALRSVADRVEGQVQILPWSGSCEDEWRQEVHEVPTGYGAARLVLGR